MPRLQAQKKVMKMINDLHFKSIEDENFALIFERMDADECEYAREIVDSLCEAASADMSVSAEYRDGILYAKVFDGQRYVFPLPFMLREDTDIVNACISIAEYAKREMIPLIISDIPRGELCLITEIFPHVDGRAYEDDDDTFFAIVKNECDLLTDFPSIEYDGIELSQILDSDLSVYAELCADKTLNKYWGYDVYEDNPDADKQYYLDTVRREFDIGSAIVLAIRENGEFTGEATIYGFDFRGSAEIAVRILPKHQGRGIGPRAVKALFEIARNIGLAELRATVKNENAGSVKMTSSVMDIVGISEEETEFSLRLK